MSSFEIVFHGYCEGEMWSQEGLKIDPSARVEQFWDESGDGRDFKDAGVTDEVLDEVWAIRKQWYSQREVHHEDDRSVVLRDEESREDGVDYYILMIGNIDNYREAFPAYLDKLILAAEHTGADDGTYDYYPAAWEVAYQIAWALGLESEYRGAYDRLSTETQYKDADLREETIPFVWGFKV